MAEKIQGYDPDSKVAALEAEISRLKQRKERQSSINPMQSQIELSSEGEQAHGDVIPDAIPAQP